MRRPRAREVCAAVAQEADSSGKEETVPRRRCGSYFTSQLSDGAIALLNTVTKLCRNCYVSAVLNLMKIAHACMCM